MADTRISDMPAATTLTGSEVVPVLQSAANARTTAAGLVAQSTHAATSKTTPVDADELPLADSAASNVLKKLTWANLKATLKTYTDTLYALVGAINGSGLTMATGKLLGRSTAATGAIEEITVGSGLSLSAGTLTATASGGDASTNTSTSVDSEVALFSGTGGKTIKRATTTGIAKLASGVLSAATAGTDYYNPGGTDVAVADGGTGVSSLTAYAVVCGGTTSTGAAQSIASVGTSGQVLTSNGAGALPTFQAAGGGSGGTKTYSVFQPLNSCPPASNFATLDTRNSIPVLNLDASTEESIFWVGIIPESASLGSGLILKIHWLGATATSGDVKWGASFERMNTDLDSDSFDTETTGTSTANGTSGIETVTSITCTTIDSVTAGDTYRVKIARKAADAADTMTGDAQIVAVEVRSAA